MSLTRYLPLTRVFLISIFLDVSMIGDRMDTDVVAGLESGLEPILVLSGVTNKTNIENYAYRPFLVVNDVGDIAPPEDSYDVPGYEN